jgi:hypothetical protein
MSAPIFPHSPWLFSHTVLQRMPSDVSKNFQKWELLTTDPEMALVMKSFLHCKPHGYAIAKIFCIHNPSHLQDFEAELINSEEEAQKFLPRWSDETDSDRKKEVIDRWKEQTSVFQPMSVGGQTLNFAKVLPLWHGSNPTKCESICESGFTDFGKLILQPFFGHREHIFLLCDLMPRISPSILKLLWC